MSLGDDLIRTFGVERVRERASLAPLTTFKVGGPADWLLETRNEQETLTGLRVACQSGVQVTILGGGSNVLVSDAGIRGLVMRPRGASIEPCGSTAVRAEAGATINGLVRWTINRGMGGLEAWAGTPGTVGGAVFGNAHYGGRGLGEVIASVRVASRDGSVHELANEDLAFSYDRSRLQDTGDVLLSARFDVVPNREPAALRAVARQSLRHRKATQPLDIASAGCIFQNLDASVHQAHPDVPVSAGAWIDRAGLKGKTIGGAVVSPTHANFILNRGGATASEIKSLIDLCKAAVLRQFGIELKEEIRLLGIF